MARQVYVPGVGYVDLAEDGREWNAPGAEINEAASESTPTTITPGAMTLTWAGQGAAAAVTISPDTAALRWTGQGVGAATVIVAAASALQWIGQALSIAQAIQPGRMTLRWTGYGVDGLGTLLRAACIIGSSFRRLIG